MVQTNLRYEMASPTRKEGILIVSCDQQLTILIQTNFTINVIIFCPTPSPHSLLLVTGPKKGTIQSWSMTIIQTGDVLTGWIRRLRPLLEHPWKRWWMEKPSTWNVIQITTRMIRHSGVGFSRAWKSTVKEHNSQSVTKWTNEWMNMSRSEW